MSGSDAPSLATLRRRRGVVRASITRLATRLGELEPRAREPTTSSLAHRMSTKLETYDSDFKTHHLAVIDAMTEGDDDGLAKEQEVLDAHDDEVASLASRIEYLLQICSSASESGTRSIAISRLLQLETRLSMTNSAIDSLSGDPKDIHLVHLYQEQLSDFKQELGHIRHEVTTQCTRDVSDELHTKITTFDKSIFDMSLRINKLLYNPVHTPEATVSTYETKGVRLPKLEVPTFDGDILHWQTFWEQFCVAIHDRCDISDTQKLVYLRHSLKDGTAKSAIEGLSRSGEHYTEAVECLKSRYSRPRLIHQTHVRKICEASPLKEGTGKELRRLHDVLQQHLRALKAMGHEPSGSFITSMMELKLDPSTIFEWQKFNQKSADVPHYSELLEFLNLRAQACETCIHDTKKTSRSDMYPTKKSQPNKPIASFAASTSESATSCILCKPEKHPLYACPRFKVLPHDKMVSIVRDNELCMNCLKPGHFSRRCGSNNRCKKCQKLHHTLIHNDAKGSSRSEQLSTASAVEPLISSNAAAGFASNALLMTCQLLVHASDGSHVKARGLLDSASSTSFVSERLAQALCLSRSSRTVSISGIGGLSHQSPLTTFNISPISSPTEEFQVTAVVIPRVTCDLPLQPVHFNSKWTHLSTLQLADPDFGHPGKIDILLGVDIYADALLHGRRNGPPGSPVAFETRFGWVLAGSTSNTRVSSHHSIASLHVAVASGDDLLRKFWEMEESPRNNSNLSPEERAVVQHFNENHTRANNRSFIVPLPKNPQARILK